MVEGLKSRSILMIRFNNMVGRLRSNGRDKKRNVHSRMVVNPTRRRGGLRMSISSRLVKGMLLRRSMTRGSVMSIMLLKRIVMIGRMEVMHFLVQVRVGVQV
jgi:hypothetical protein